MPDCSATKSVGLFLGKKFDLSAFMPILPNHFTLHDVYFTQQDLFTHSPGWQGGRACVHLQCFPLGSRMVEGCLQLYYETHWHWACNFAHSEMAMTEAVGLALLQKSSPVYATLLGDWRTTPVCERERERESTRLLSEEKKYFGLGLTAVRVRNDQTTFSLCSLHFLSYESPLKLYRI